jgi:hypothetical protein
MAHDGRLLLAGDVTGLRRLFARQAKGESKLVLRRVESLYAVGSGGAAN